MSKEQIYVIGDVHGCYNTLLALINKLPENAKICFVGDLIDRGPESAQVVRFVRENGYDCVLGNHELMCLEENGNPHDEYSVSNVWGANGGIAAVNSYNGDIAQLEDDMEWFASLPTVLFYKDIKDEQGRALMVSHSAGCFLIDHYLKIAQKLQEGNYTSHELIDYEHTLENSTNHMLWGRTVPKSGSENFFNVFGHSPIDVFIFDRDGEDKIDRTKYLTKEKVVVNKDIGYADIDTGCVYGKSSFRGKLTAIAYPSLEIFQQEVID